MSDVFEEYAKIAVEQGLVKEASLDKNAEEETNPRYDSLDLDAIEMLYGVKPNGDDEKHIVEQAHPEPAVVAPAYDRVNGLVENGLERQDVMHWIATKPNHGKHIQERYVKAHQELVNEVVKAAFILDRDNEQELMAFADSCAERLVVAQDEIKKEAIAWVPVLLYLGGASLGTLGLVNNFGGMMDAGFVENCNRAVEEINDLITDNELPGEQESLQELVESIEDLKLKYEEVNSFTISPNDDQEKVKEDVKHGEGLLKEFIAKARRTSSKITAMSHIIESSGETEDSWMSRNLGDLGLGVEKLVETFWSSDKQDAVVIMDTLKESIDKSIGKMRRYFSAVKAKADAAKAKMEEESVEVPKEEPTEAPKDVAPEEDLNEKSLEELVS